MALKLIRDFIETLRLDMAQSRSLKSYMSDSVTQIGTSKEGKMVIVLDFAPTIQPEGPAFDAICKRWHEAPTVKKSAGKHIVTFNGEMFDLRMVYSGVIDKPDMSIEGSQP